MNFTILPQKVFEYLDSELVHWSIRERHKRRIKLENLSSPQKGLTQSMSIYETETGTVIASSSEYIEHTLGVFRGSLPQNQCFVCEYPIINESNTKSERKTSLHSFSNNQQQNQGKWQEWSMLTRRLPTPSIDIRCPEFLPK